MLIKEVLAKSNQFLKAKGIESSRLDAELIIAHILKMERISLYLKHDQPLTEEELGLCRAKILERSKGAPVAYILNKKYFYNYEFYVDSTVLIPRPETEILVEETVSWIKKEHPLDVSVLELGCGSGCISIAMVAELQKAKFSMLKFTAIDICEAAIEISKTNAERILVDKQPIEFLVRDAAVFIDTANFDVVVANPPYIAHSDPAIQISVKEFEPHRALFAEDDGLNCIKTWSLTALKLLKPNGFLMFEIGCEQGLVVDKLFRDSGFFSSIELVKDYSGLNRFIKAVRSG